MLKRSQLLIEGWQMDQMREEAEMLDLSISEINRVRICVFKIYFYHASGGGLKQIITMKALSKFVNDLYFKELTKEEKSKILSKIYFEARKVVEG